MQLPTDFIEIFYYIFMDKEKLQIFIFLFRFFLIKFYVLYYSMLGDV